MLGQRDLGAAGAERELELVPHQLAVQPVEQADGDVWPEIAPTRRCSSRLSSEYLSGLPSATERLRFSPSSRSCAASASVMRSAPP